MYLVYGTYPDDPESVRFSGRYTAACNLFSATDIVREYEVCEALPAELDDYRLAHTEEYVEILRNVERTGKSCGSISSEAVAFEKIGVGGTLMATRLAIASRDVAYHLGGGYHHGMPDRPNSIDYCNDVAIGLAYLLSAGITKILYVDLDAHHPDGVQEIFGGNPHVFQVSLHEKSFFGGKGQSSFIGKGVAAGSKVNMPLPCHTGDRAYLQILESILSSVMKSYDPGAVFYQAGVDPYVQDPVGRLSLSLQGLYARDALVASLCRRKSIPFVIVLGGGYHPSGGPKAIVNTLAAFAGKGIVFDEPGSVGSPSAEPKAYRAYDTLRAHLHGYVELEEWKYA
jgi:acetoin utilization deacetylase AcuC-like enzyme